MNLFKNQFTGICLMGLFVLLATSCNNNNNAPTPNTTNEIIGKWKAQKVTDETNNMDLTAQYNQYSLEIKGDNSYNLTQKDGSSESGSWSLSSDGTIINLSPSSGGFKALTQVNTNNNQLQFKATENDQKTGQIILAFVLIAS